MHNKFSSLTDLVTFEKSVLEKIISNTSDVEVTFSKPLDVSMSLKTIVKFKVQIHISIDSELFSTFLDRPIIHQIFARTTKDDNWNSALQEFNAAVVKGNIFLVNLCKTILTNNNLKIRYTKDDNKNIIYGIVSNLYKTVNQIEFRDKLIEEMLESNLIKENKYQTVVTKFNDVEEFYLYNSQNSPIDFKMGISFGKNNGYKSYKIKWVRKIIETSNFITPFESKENFTWRNNSKSEISQFREFIAEEGRKQSELLKRCIERSKDELIGQELLNFMINKFRIAYATKEKILHQYNSYIIQKGENLFSFSQALCKIADDKYTSKSTKWLLREHGTESLIKGLEKYKQVEEIKLSYNYDIYSK